MIETLPGKGYVLKEHHRPLRKGIHRGPLAAEIDQAIVQAPCAVGKTLTYSLLTFLLGALYLALVGGIGTLIVRAGLIRGESVAVLSTVVVAAVFLPLRTLVQQFVDRLVFAKRYELARAMQLMKADAVVQPDLDSFMERVIERSEAVLGARPELIRDHAEVLSLVNSLPSLRSARAPISSGADFLMPVFSDDELLGVLRLATRSTGHEYDAEDKPGESEKPAGQDSGYLWRIDSWWRWEEHDGGVYVECESVSLTRDIPTGLGWLIRPFVTSIPKESLQSALGSTRSALLARVAGARNP